MNGESRDTWQYKPDLECKKVLRKIDLARKSKNLSIHRLAEKAEIASSTLNEMLHGKTAPQLYTLYKICNAMEIPISEFLGDTLVDVNDVEIDFLTKYRCLPEWKREMLNEYLEMLIQYKRKEQTTD